MRLLQVIAILSAVSGLVFLGTSEVTLSVSGDFSSYHVLVWFFGVAGLVWLACAAPELNPRFIDLDQHRRGPFVKAFFGTLVLLMSAGVLAGRRLHMPRVLVQPPTSEPGSFYDGTHLVMTKILGEPWMRRMNIGAFACLSIFCLCVSRVINSPYEYGFMLLFLELTLHMATEMGIENGTVVNVWYIIVAIIFCFFMIFFRCVLELENENRRRRPDDDDHRDLEDGRRQTEVRGGGQRENGGGRQREGRQRERSDGRQRDDGRGHETTEATQSGPRDTEIVEETLAIEPYSESNISGRRSGLFRRRRREVTPELVELIHRVRPWTWRGIFSKLLRKDRDRDRVHA